jgi:hypothetical protein
MAVVAATYVGRHHKRSVQIMNGYGYLDCSSMFVPMHAMSTYRGTFHSNLALAPLGSRSLSICSG